MTILHPVAQRAEQDPERGSDYGLPVAEPAPGGGDVDRSQDARLDTSSTGSPVTSA